MQIDNTLRPWILGTYAIYAAELETARLVYEYLSSRDHPRAFGTMQLDGREAIDWVNITFGTARQNNGPP